MAKSICDIVKEIQYWLRLATFLHGPLKSFLLHVLHNLGNDPSYTGLPQNPQQLYQKFSTRSSQNKINNLKGRKVLQQDQIDKLLPPNGNATDSSVFDITLLCILIRSFTTLPAPINGWGDKNPPLMDISIAAFVIRAREWRNYIHHTEPDKITQAEFEDKWKEGELIINQLGFAYNTTQLKTMSLDLKYENVVKSMYLYLERKQEALAKQQTELANKVNTLDNQQDDLAIQQASTSQDVVKLKNSTTQQIGDLTQQMKSQIEQQNLNSEEIKSLEKRLKEITIMLKQFKDIDAGKHDKNTGNN